MQQTVTIHSIMLDFAYATGLTDTSREPRRYLWTDAFALCNYLQLYRQTSEKQYLQLALKLVDQVHLTLGKHHSDSEHRGWLSGLDEEQARLHPTRAGLRIGKRLNERQANETFDDHLEWDRDGQYFHYLTKWMHALNRVSQVTGKSIYNQWALELAKAAHAAFCYTPIRDGGKRMYWKMSIDLSRPQVDSMGQHDPLDGLITCLQLAATAKDFPETPTELNLDTEIEELAAMCAGGNWVTEDSLGIGGLLTDAYTLVQLIAAHHLHETGRLESLLDDIERCLQAFVTNNQLNLPAEYRLAFRELGLSIGLHAIGRMQKTIEHHPEKFTNSQQLSSTLNNLSRFHPMNEFIENFWLEAEHRSVRSWQEHADINNVMLATSLAPDGYL
ncbi:MAG: hypothetical protein ACNYZG_03895 [Gammaproteobacteria bacterium]